MKPCSRRSFLRTAIDRFALLCLWFIPLGCDRSGEQEVTAAKERFLSLGTVTDLKSGINEFTTERLLVVRNGPQLWCQSMVCTHQVCVLQLTNDKVICPCHGSLFALEGDVLSGPATLPLPRYALSIDAEQRLVVALHQTVSRDWRLKI